MAKLGSRVLWGIILIVAGFLFLAESLGLMMLNSIWPFVFGIAGILFVYSFINDRNQWWAIIPGFTLLGLASIILIDVVFPHLAGGVTGGVFLGWIALSFITILISTRGQQWWAIFPSGAISTVALIAVFEPYIADETSGAIVMLGLAATFVVVYLMHPQGKHMRWALYPAVILSIIGVLFLGSALQIAQLVWPIALIAVGLYLIIKNMRGQKKLE